jgi:hypothetical protein
MSYLEIVNRMKNVTRRDNDDDVKTGQYDTENLPPLIKQREPGVRRKWITEFFNGSSKGTVLLWPVLSILLRQA